MISICFRQHRRFASQLARARPVQMTILDPWIPADKLPSILSKSGRTYIFERVKNFLLASWTVRTIKKNVVGWKPKEFAKQAQETYVAMNRAYLGNKKEELRAYVTPGMFAQLNPTMGVKDMRYEWEFHGEVERPRMVHARVAKTQLEHKGKEHYLVQCTVRMHTNQSISIYKKNKLELEGKVTPVLEYIVMERVVTLPDKDWIIAGKIEPKGQSK